MLKHVLIVDDSPVLRSLYAEWLAAYTGGPVTSVFACNGREALERLAESPLLDLIITDVKMPEMDGLTFLTHLRRDYSAFDIPVILASTRANAVIEHEKRGAELGITTHLLKPFGQDALHAALDRVWGTPVSS